MKKIFALFAIASLFAVACSKDDDKKDGDDNKKPSTEYNGPVQGTSEWSVIGSFAEEKIAMNWDNDLVMAAAGDVFVLKDLKLTAADEFKIRKNKDWAENRGGNFAELGLGFAVTPDGGNIKPGVAGLYDVYYNPAKEQMAVCAAGKEPEYGYIAPITIDGEYADWATLNPADVATATCAADAKYTDLKSVKVYADEQYVFFYCEFTPALEGYVTMDVFLNADNSDETGGYGDHWTDANAEWLYEGAVDGWDAGLFKWWGEVGASGWSWTDPSVTHDGSDNWGAIIGEGNGISSSAGSVESGKAEFAIMRAAVEELVEFADEFSIGFMLSAEWAEKGFLPCADVTDDNTNGIAPKLKVKVVK